MPNEQDMTGALVMRRKQRETQKQSLLTSMKEKRKHLFARDGFSFLAYGLLVAVILFQGIIWVYWG